MFRKSLVLAVVILAGLACAQAADVTGKWNAVFDSQVGTQTYVFDLKSDGSKLTGKAISKIGDATEPTATEITDGKIEGNTISFTENLNYSGMELKITYKGTVSGDEIKFARSVGDSGGEEFVAKRAK